MENAQGKFRKISPGAPPGHHGALRCTRCAPARVVSQGVIVLYMTMVQVRLLGQRINYFYYCFVLFILFSQKRQDPLFVYMVLYNSIFEILD